MKASMPQAAVIAFIYRTIEIATVSNLVAAAAKRNTPPLGASSSRRKQHRSNLHREFPSSRNTISSEQMHLRYDAEAV
ncbi:hypothetical protein LR48_Vigan630s001800 [Vigna angularis]|uniref:Uncharacterized protein n=1 Tax=Phaseolus angularis TaxID=3914 RepID=A0A0L9TG34_PHAAN|nr:hypothetical protein LR48_Vigan630s001800 [Vigna angularis]